jgi:hypothetical protein
VFVGEKGLGEIVTVIPVLSKSDQSNSRCFWDDIELQGILVPQASHIHDLIARRGSVSGLLLDLVVYV